MPARSPFPAARSSRATPTPAAAALREAEEEIGLAPELVDVVGYLDPYLTRTGYRIVPVLGRVDPGFGCGSTPMRWKRPSRCRSPS